MDNRKEDRPISSAGPLVMERCPVCGKRVEAYDAANSTVYGRDGERPLSCIVLFAHRTNQRSCEGSRLKISLADHLIREFQEVLNG